jgi:hypothetical protein
MHAKVVSGHTNTLATHYHSQTLIDQRMKECTSAAAALTQFYLSTCGYFGVIGIHCSNLMPCCCCVVLWLHQVVVLPYPARALPPCGGSGANWTPLGPQPRKLVWPTSLGPQPLKLVWPTSLVLPAHTLLVLTKAPWVLPTHRTVLPTHLPVLPGKHTSVMPLVSTSLVQRANALVLPALGNGTIKWLRPMALSTQVRAVLHMPCAVHMECTWNAHGMHMECTCVPAASRRILLCTLLSECICTCARQQWANPAAHLLPSLITPLLHASPYLTCTGPAPLPCPSPRLVKQVPVGPPGPCQVHGQPPAAHHPAHQHAPAAEPSPGADSCSQHSAPTPSPAAPALNTGAAQAGTPYASFPPLCCSASPAGCSQ